ncbi:hypothetical protein CEXT_231011 [Caerostris extrusa]|uniref:Uncharacterized protein n=1 Tax=Caerostris extrusa TaxID=172846 RepID=A0AAV4VRK5_CAEEX|nr:hypothetical protein CEXT_231011 [Caerostris extrusa]
MFSKITPGSGFKNDYFLRIKDIASSLHVFSEETSITAFNKEYFRQYKRHCPQPPRFRKYTSHCIEEIYFLRYNKDTAPSLHFLENTPVTALKKKYFLRYKRHCLQPPRFRKIHQSLH